jgi:SAM-dependent methyltransferase
MERIPEPELMEDVEQAEAYARADFEDAHSRFIEAFRLTFPDHPVQGPVLDLGCGPGDIAFRFARAYPESVVHGLDGSRAMLDCGRKILSTLPELGGRVELLHGLLPGASLPEPTYSVVISNSLLHHLHQPEALWNAVGAHAAPGAPVFIMDLKRPKNTQEAETLVEEYASGEPLVLRRDFYNSLLAAFEPGEVVAQLKASNLSHLQVREVSDRHLVVSGCR